MESRKQQQAHTPATSMSESYSTPYTSCGGPARSAPVQPQLLQQDQIIRQQDQSLDQLSRSVATLHRMGSEINGELRAQNVLLDDLEQGVDQTQAALISQQSRLKKLIKKSKDNWLICVIILLVIGLGVILYFGAPPRSFDRCSPPRRLRTFSSDALLFRATQCS